MLGWSSATSTWGGIPDVAVTGGGGKGGKDGPGKTLEEWSSLIGIVTAIVGNVLIALALNVQRYAHTRLQRERAYARKRAKAATKKAQHTSHGGGSYGTVGNGHEDRTDNGRQSGHDEGYRNHDTETEPLTGSFHSGASDEENGDDAESKAPSTYLKSPYWWLGQILITLGEMGNFLAYGFAPASIVSPLGVVALVSNCVIAPLMFKERFRARDFWGVIVAVGGVVTVVLSANTEETKLNPHAVWDAITTIEFEIYMTCTISLIIVLMWASSRYGGRTILIDLGLVGLFGGYTALATKGVSSMLSATLWRAFTTPVTYALIFVLLATAIMQIRYVNKALQHFDSTQVIPIQFVMFTLCVILGSAVLYRDFEKTTAEQAGKFVGGCLLTFFGVFLITSGRGSSRADEEDALSEIEGVEETIGLADHEGNEATSATPVTRSRRSSKSSRGSFTDTITPKTHADGMEDPALQQLKPTSTNSSLAPESAPLLGDPWGDVDKIPATPPPRGIRTFSADLIMRGSAVASTPSRSQPTTPMRDGLGPPVYPTDQHLTPAQKAQTLRPAYAHRSGTFINPSPLSSTVTSVMKDGFFGGSNNRSPLARKSSMGRIRSSIRASLFFNDNDSVPKHNVSAIDDNLTRDDGAQARPPLLNVHTDEDLSRRRARSVSDTLGDFFRPKRKKRRDDGDDLEDGQPGPSA